MGLDGEDLERRRKKRAEAQRLRRKRKTRTLLLPVAYLLSLTGDVNAVWWSYPVAEVASALGTALLFAKLYRQKVKPLFAGSQE